MRAWPLTGGGAELTVEDDGPVPAEQMTRLFEPFWRGERADLRNDGGTGLGLTMARELVGGLGGLLAARSRPDYPGMQFTVRMVA